MKRMELLQVKAGTLLEVQVKPRSKNFKIVVNSVLIAFCTQSPVKGKANRELVRELSKIFRKKVEIISGFHSKRKKVLVHDTVEEEVREILTTI